MPKNENEWLYSTMSNRWRNDSSGVRIDDEDMPEELYPLPPTSNTEEGYRA